MLLASSYLAFGYLGIQLATLSYGISLIWPPIGIAIALLLRWDLRLWPAIIAGGIPLEMLASNRDWLFGLQISLSSAIPIYLCCSLLRQFSFDARLEHQKDLILFGLIAILGCPALLAFMGVALLTWHDVIMVTDFFTAWWNWLLGDITGVLIFGIALLTFDLNRLAILFKPGMLLVFGLMLLLGMELFVWQATPFVLALSLLPVLGLIWIAMRTNLAVTSWVVLLFSCVAGYGALNQAGIFAGLPDPPLGTWLYITSLGMASLIVAVTSMENRLEAEQMRYAIGATNLGTWDWRMDEDRIEVNDNWFRMLGQPPRSGEIRFVDFAELLHPQDRDPTQKAIGQYLKGQTDQYRLRLRMRHANGTWRDIQSTGAVTERDFRGSPLRMCGTHMDITEQLQTRLELDKTYNFLNRISEQIPGAIYQFRMDAQGHASFPFANGAIEKLLGVTVEKLRETAQPCFANIHPDDLPGFLESIEESRQNLSLWRAEFRVNSPRIGWREAYSRPQRLEDGSTLWHGYITDISERKDMEIRIQNLALTDELTGIENRRAFLNQLEQEWNRCKRHGGPPSFVIIADIDHFKRVNDSHGHDVGDKMLCHFTALIQQSIRRNDSFGRLGGEEFGILVTDSSLEDIQALAEKLRATVAASPLRIQDGLELSLTASFGIARLKEDSAAFDDALLRADRALYAAKHSGRNRVCMENSHGDPPSARA
nr:diguanylate cyclase [Bowmanella dokdonensis]